MQNILGLNCYAYVLNNPLTLTDPSGMDSSCDPSNGCISINIGGVCLLFCGGHSEDRQPPIYTPPDTQNTTDPNPPAGDPDPSDPFSGPVWQEGGPQIQPTGNLAELLGVPNPPMLVFDNTDSEGPQTLTPQQSYQQCMASFNNSTIGKVTSFFSVLNIPSNLADWFVLGGAKLLGVKVLDKAEASAAPAEYSIATGEATDAAVNVGSKILGELGLFGIATATVVDADARLTCSGNPPTLGPFF